MRSSHLLSIFAVALVAGCVVHTNEPASRTSTTGAGIQGSNAVRRIADARCDREVGCNNIGDGHRFDSRDACIREMRRDTRDALDDKACEGGIDEARLNECIRDIRGERCGNPFDSINRAASCRRAELCRGR